MREKIIDILMKRDGLSRLNAENFYEETMEEIRLCVEDGDIEDAEYIFTHDIGLEMDYFPFDTF